MNSNTSIRLATISDAAAIAHVHIRSWQMMYKDFIPESILMNLSLKERTQQWQTLIQQNVNVLVTTVDDRIVGFASFCAFRDAAAKSSAGEISAIYLLPDYWRQGLGTKLCQMALAELMQLEFKVVYLWVLKANAQARSFYESLGFTELPDTKLEEFYEGGALLTEILYKKTL
ncbi:MULTISPECIES: GNAT family N-acetyltransferase [Legionella]|uniref:GNAT family N-acetyltransferase n=1 Tax=Legionella TaxID=445 RepID=UPI000F8DD894|nr:MULTISPECIES: GNAT family N-acetyltransferase [Legionella]MCP0914602.1 GNAT family N-acetyltransferase [Legionella sp. 27cVA30]RUQ96172.1 GNAT family N-acetyltransferase [Legionella septentrionalis]RUR14300.1 GNAT family N-acetyltransferase [Legionella septentrionalis]